MAGWKIQIHAVSDSTSFRSIFDYPPHFKRKQRKLISFLILLKIQV